MTVGGNVVLHHFDRDRLEATVTPGSLPCVLLASGEIGLSPWNYLDDPSKGFRAALEVLPINNDLLSVSGLGQRVYEVLMDGVIVLIAESDDLVRGISLQ